MPRIVSTITIPEGLTEQIGKCKLLFQKSVAAGSAVSLAWAMWAWFKSGVQGNVVAKAFDLVAQDQLSAIYPDVACFPDPYETLDYSDLLIVMME